MYNSDLPPGQSTIHRILRWGIDHSTISGPIPKINLSEWHLTINGEVNKPQKLSWREILHFPEVELICDFHCVEGWSVRDCRWGGFSFKDVKNVVLPKETAKFVYFECVDGYKTSLSLNDLSK